MGNKFIYRLLGGVLAYAIVAFPTNAGAGFLLNPSREIPKLNTIFSPSGFHPLDTEEGIGSGIEFSIREDTKRRTTWLDIKTPNGTQSLPYESSSEQKGEARGLRFSLTLPIEWRIPYGARILISDSDIRVVIPKSDGTLTEWSFRSQGCGIWHVTSPDGATVSADGTHWTEEK
jgi:hypothetical protein